MPEVEAKLDIRTSEDVVRVRQAVRALAIRIGTTEEDFDAIHVALIRMIPYVWNSSLAQERSDGSSPLVVDLIDSLTLNLEDRRHSLSGPMRLGYEIEYRRVRSYEREVVKRLLRVNVSSTRDQRLVRHALHIMPLRDRQTGAPSA